MSANKTLAATGVYAIVLERNQVVVGLQLSGTWTGTADFQASMDNGATWVSVAGVPVTSGLYGASAVQATANGNWLFVLGGFTHFRVSFTRSSGSLVVDVEVSDGPAAAQTVAVLSAASQSDAFDVATTITRPANTTPYSAGDVLGGAIDLGVLGPSGQAVMITGVQLEADISSVPSGQTSWELHLYSVTPPSAVADNGAFDLPSGDRASYLGYIPIPSLTDLGSTCYGEVPIVNKQVKLAGTHLFAYLKTVGGFTPAANSEVYKVTVHTVAV